MRSLLKKPYWSFIGVALAIIFYFFPYSPHEPDGITSMSWLSEAGKWILISGAFIFAVYAYLRPSRTQAEKVLKDIANAHKNKEVSQWGYGVHDYCSAVQIHDTWQQWINQLIKVTGRQELEPHNFGDFFYIYDFSAGEITEFPKDKTARESVIGNRFLTGKILRVIPKE